MARSQAEPLPPGRTLTTFLDAPACPGALRRQFQRRRQFQSSVVARREQSRYSRCCRLRDDRAADARSLVVQRQIELTPGPLAGPLPNHLTALLLPYLSPSVAPKPAHLPAPTSPRPWHAAGSESLTMPSPSVPPHNGLPSRLHSGQPARPDPGRNPDAPLSPAGRPLPAWRLFVARRQPGLISRPSAARSVQPAGIELPL